MNKFFIYCNYPFDLYQQLTGWLANGASNKDESKYLNNNSLIKNILI